MKTPKNQMELQQETLRGTLLTRLLDAVKQCQGHFGSKKSVAVDTDSRVSCLLAQLEAVFCHGMKRNNSALSTIMQVTEMVTKLSLDQFDSSENSLWCCIRCVLSEEESERFCRLRNISTDAGRGRAWLRASLNERSLERYLQTLLGHHSVLERFYEEWAFLRDPDLSETLPQIARGLSTILFAINIDNEELNSSRGVPTETSDLLVEANKAPKPIMAVGQQNNSRQNSQKKKRKPLVNVVSFDAPRRISDSEGHMKVFPKKQLSADSGTIDAVLDSWNSKEEASETTKSADAISESEMGLECEGKGGVDEWRQTDTPVSDQFNSLASSRICSVSSADDADSSVFRSIVLEKGDSFEPTFLPRSGDSGASVGDSANDIDSVASSSKHSREDSGSVADEDPEKNSDLKSKLETQLETIEELKGEIARMAKDTDEELISVQSKLAESQKENAMLKSQVKSYVEVLQGMKEEEESGEHSVTHASYEHKLIQVAEMHAELMEFNERLVHQLNRRKIQVNRLRNELIELRGPMPTDDFGEDFGSGSSGGQDPGGSGRAVVNIWIPSAFLTGKGTDVHHVYQIYIRVRESEWNLYRRYSDFVELRHFLRKQEPHSATFKFPPKKAVGKKEKKFVEERRKGLELYLRTAVNYVVQNFPEFSAVPVNKDTLAEQLPFFRMRDVQESSDRRKK